MNTIDKKRKFIPVNITVLTISDTRNKKNDKSGKLLIEKIRSSGHNLKYYKIIKDDISLITRDLKFYTKNKNVDIIITTGGTGLTVRDSTPEAIEKIADKIILGFGELFRQISYKNIGTSTIQSRSLGAIINGKYIFALPGSPSACSDAWNKILKYQLDNRFRPCNFIELIPRLKNR